MIIDMPKLESPFEREKQPNGSYICIPKIREEYRWVFSANAIATDKLDGTNVSIAVSDGHIKAIFNRTSQVFLFTKGSKHFYEGICNAVERGYFLPVEDGQFFGELIGEKIQGNPYQIKGHLWMPLQYLKAKFHYKFWAGFVKELEGKSDEEIFTATSELFKGLWSIYKLHIGIPKTEVTENMKFEGCAAEGMVFHNPLGEMCKLRRDMFLWFKGQRHDFGQ
jgi:hypothetical protein